MDDITIKALENFQKNLKYLEENHRAVFDKINLLNLLIEEGEYIERYALEFINESYFDVLEVASGEFLYGENSLSYSKEIVNMTNFRKTGGVFQAQKYAEFSPEMPDLIDKSDLHFHNALWATIKIIEYVALNANKTTSSMIWVYKSIFLGTGLGLHLPGILHKLNTKIAFIQEDNLELFRLSLFVTDYAKLSKKTTLFFSVMQTKSEERQLFVDFLETGNNYNLYLKHIPFIKEYEPKLQTLQTHVLSQDHISYGYSALLLRFIDSPRYLTQNYSFINISKSYPDTVFTKKPVLFLFSGPSTAKQIKWIQANHARFIIVSALSTCRLLNTIGVSPDVVLHMDPDHTGTLALFEELDHKTFFKNTFCLFSSNIDPNTIEKFDRSRIYLIEQGTQYKQGFENLSSYSVGEYAYALFLLLGTSELYLLGLDFALDPETLQSHSQFHPFAVTGETKLNDPSLDYKTAIEYVRGNLLNEVPTLATYKLSLNQFERFTKMLKKENQHVYNLGNGAYLEGAEPLNIEEQNWSQYPVIDRNNLFFELDTFFGSISSNEFRDVDKEVLQYQIQEAKKLLFKIMQHKKVKYKNIDMYLAHIAQLGFDLSDMDNITKSYLAEVYYEYFKVILSYIYDLFNTKELDNPTQHVKAIDAILVAQLEKMGNLFVNKLEDYFK